MSLTHLLLILLQQLNLVVVVVSFFLLFLVTFFLFLAMRSQSYCRFATRAVCSQRERGEGGRKVEWNCIVTDSCIFTFTLNSHVGVQTYMDRGYRAHICPSRHLQFTVTGFDDVDSIITERVLFVKWKAVCLSHCISS